MSWLLKREARLQQMRALESLKRLGRNESNDSGVVKGNSGGAQTDKTI